MKTHGRILLPLLILLAVMALSFKFQHEAKPAVSFQTKEIPIEDRFPSRIIVPEKYWVMKDPAKDKRPFPPEKKPVIRNPARAVVPETKPAISFQTKEIPIEDQFPSKITVPEKYWVMKDPAKDKRPFPPEKKPAIRNPARAVAPETKPAILFQTKEIPIEDQFPSKITVLEKYWVMKDPAKDKRPFPPEKKTVIRNPAQAVAPAMKASQTQHDNPKEKPEAIHTQAQKGSTNIAFNVPNKDLQTFLVVKKDGLSVFSAFIDGDKVRILGYKLQQYSEKPTCEFLLGQPEQQPSLVEATMQNIPEHHGRKFTACYVFCNIPSGMKSDSIQAVRLRPRKVSDKDQNMTTAAAILPIQQFLDRHSKGDNWEAEFTVCLAPIQNGYNGAKTIVEMIELNRMLGAQKLIFYNYSMGRDLHKVLSYYQSKKVVQLINWPIPLKVGPDDISPDIHYYGQLLAHNDCLYRSRHHSKYVVFQDIDEFIVPKTKGITTWADLIAIRKKADPSAKNFMFKNCFFRRELKPEEGDLAKFKFNSSIAENESVVLSTVYREKVFYRFNDRSKCIVDPLQTATVGIHNIWESLGSKLDQVPESIAFVHHYRDFHQIPSKDKLEYDESLLVHYGAGLVGAVKKAWENI